MAKKKSGYNTDVVELAASLNQVLLDEVFVKRTDTLSINTLIIATSSILVAYISLIPDMQAQFVKVDEFATRLKDMLRDEALKKLQDAKPNH